MYINDDDCFEDKKMRKVQYRGGFSDRNGIKKIATKIQLKKFDDRTKMAISNLFFEFISGENEFNYFSNNDCEQFFKKLIAEVYCESVADFYFFNTDRRRYYKDYIEEAIINGDYADILTLVEFFVEFVSINEDNFYWKKVRKNMSMGEVVVALFNDVFEREYVGYRIIDRKAVPISNEQEQTAIQEALKTPFDGCRIHIRKSLEFLSDRKKPDYKNSIKESISAVESVCKIIVGKDNAQLGDMLKVLENKRGLKGPLKSAFEKLYSYTNDKGGIRHAEGLFVSDVTFEEAKFMLVSCSAFVNYLIAEYGKIEGN